MPQKTRTAPLLAIFAFVALVGSALAAEPRFQFPDQQLADGTDRLEVPLLISVDTEIQGFEVYGSYDPAVLRLEEVTLEGTALAGKEVGKELLFLPADLTPPHFYVSILTSFGEVTLLPAGEEQVVLRLLFEVIAGAPATLTTNVTFVRDEHAFYDNGVFVGNNRVSPAFLDGTIELGAPPGRRFLRGDADDSGGVDISDPILTLSFLFLGAERPPCLDAADIFDRGVVDISSPIAALSFLFSDGPPPAAPFPDSGVDPTPDALECQ